MDNVKLAELIATGAHYGQVDKGGNPYINHPKTVASLVNTTDEKTVAWLHDVVEDTNIEIVDLYSLFSVWVVAAVDAITRKPNEDRQVYLNRVKANPIARVVKLADLKHNSDLSRIKRPLTQKDFDRYNRYQEEIKFLAG